MEKKVEAKKSERLKKERWHLGAHNQWLLAPLPSFSPSSVRRRKEGVSPCRAVAMETKDRVCRHEGTWWTTKGCWHGKRGQRPEGRCLHGTVSKGCRDTSETHQSSCPTSLRLHQQCLWASPSLQTNNSTTPAICPALMIHSPSIPE